MIAIFLDDIFTELERRKVEVTVYARSKPLDNNRPSFGDRYEVTLSLGYSVSVSSYGKNRIAVEGAGSTYREAMTQAYEQLRGLIEVLEAKPVPDVPEPPLSRNPDDEIPF